MDPERDTDEGQLMADPLAVAEHELTRLRVALQLAEARAYALELELAHARGKLRAYESMAPSYGRCPRCDLASQRAEPSRESILRRCWPCSAPRLNSRSDWDTTWPCRVLRALDHGPSWF